MADIWTAPSGPAAGVASRAEMISQRTDNIDVLSRAIDGDSSASTIKHRHREGTNAAIPVPGEPGRLYRATDDPKCVYWDTGAAWIIIAGEVPHCRVTRATDFSVPYNAVTAVLFDTERWDNDGMHSTVSNTSRITINKAGLYSVGACANWQNVTGGYRQLGIRLNGGSTYLVLSQIDPTANASPVVNINCDYRFAAADYIEVTAFQNRTAGSAAVLSQANNYSPDFWATFLGA